MPFEYDPKKSKVNLAKHGIDFIQAQDLWLDENRLEIEARTVDEPRVLVIGLIRRKCYSAVVTYREGNTRIISVRRARVEEVECYEN
jgi:uncharacterized DUF497 family protein